MSMLPVPFSEDPQGFTSRQLAKARKLQTDTELAVFRHALGAEAMADMDRADSNAVFDATRTSLEHELELLEFGLRQAGGSPAKAELVARAANLLSNCNNQRLTRRFGG